jgi:site-specific recombinase XerD
MDLQLLASKFYDYSLYVRGFSKATVRRYRHIINYYSKHAGVSRIDQATAESVKEMLFDGRMRRGWKPVTSVTYRETLLVFFRWCMGEGCLQSNPADGIEDPKLEKQLPKRIRKDDALRLLEAAFNYPYLSRFLSCRNHAIFATFIYAGLRKKELLRLKLADVDVANLTIFISQGKGSKDRIVPMSYPLAQSLSRYLEERKRLRKTCPELFTSFRRNVGFTDTGLQYVVRDMREATGVRFSIHRLRHTFATLMLEGGCDIYSLSRMLGHSDIKTTTVYLSASAEHLRSQIQKHPLNTF